MPTITSVDVLLPAGQTGLRSGQQATITVHATGDPDQTAHLNIQVSQGTLTGATVATVTLTAGPLAYSATADVGTVVPVAGTPGQFTYTAP